MAKRRGLGWPENEHRAMVDYALEEAETFLKEARHELAAGDCHQAARAVGYAYNEVGRARGHVQGMATGRSEKDAGARHELERVTSALLEANRVRDAVLKSCLVVRRRRRA